MTSVGAPGSTATSGAEEPAADGSWATGTRAAGAAIVGGLAWAVLGGPLQLGWGLLAVALFVGWAVGAAARSAHPGRGPRTARIAGLAGGGAWLVALTGVYVFLAAQPSGTAASGSLTGSPSILDFYAGNLGLLELAQGLAVVVMAWRTAR